jgi:ABC-type molybdate transport system substrate-binding protein
MKGPRGLVAVLAILTGSAHAQSQALTIYAAASLTDAFRSFDPNQRYSFAGSNALETQIATERPRHLRLGGTAQRRSVSSDRTSCRSR